MKHDRRKWLWTAAGAGFALAAGVGVKVWQRDRGSEFSSLVGPMLTHDLSGKLLDPAQFQGMPVLVNFWATWCAPCVEELPLLDRFHATHAASGWRVLGLAVDQAVAVARFVQRVPVSFPVVAVGAQALKTMQTLGNAQGALPFTVVFSPNGRITQRKIGQLSPTDLDQWRNEPS